MPRKIQNACKNKQKAYQKFLLTNSKNVRSIFKQNKRKCVNLIRKAKGYRIKNFQKTIFYLNLEINFFNYTNALQNQNQTDNVDITLAQFDNFCTSIGPEKE